jgi:hypothetical protein
MHPPCRGRGDHLRRRPPASTAARGCHPSGCERGRKRPSALRPYCRSRRLPLPRRCFCLRRPRKGSTATAQYVARRPGTWPPHGRVHYLRHSCLRARQEGHQGSACLFNDSITRAAFSRGTALIGLRLFAVKTVTMRIQSSLHRKADGRLPRPSPPWSGPDIPALIRLSSPWLRADRQQSSSPLMPHDQYRGQLGIPAGVRRRLIGAVKSTSPVRERTTAGRPAVVRSPMAAPR